MKLPDDLTNSFCIDSIQMSILLSEFEVSIRTNSFFEFFFRYEIVVVHLFFPWIR
jgi:hypothetical protein